MASEMHCCCNKQSSWIFVYENKEPRGVCDIHFKSKNHRLFVKHVINFESAKLFSPEEIFEEITA